MLWSVVRIFYMLKSLLVVLFCLLGQIGKKGFMPYLSEEPWSLVIETKMTKRRSAKVRLGVKYEHPSLYYGHYTRKLMLITSVFLNPVESTSESCSDPTYRCKKLFKI